MKLLKRAQTAIEQGLVAGQHDETVLQQSRFWMRAITWGLIGTTGFAVAWLVLQFTPVAGVFAAGGAMLLLAWGIAGSIHRDLGRTGGQRQRPR